MDDSKTCDRCGHLCHCIEADHEGCKCTGCNCANNRSVWHVSSDEQDRTFENEVNKSNG